MGRRDGHVEDKHKEAQSPEPPSEVPIPEMTQSGWEGSEESHPGWGEARDPTPLLFGRAERASGSGAGFHRSRWASQKV